MQAYVESALLYFLGALVFWAIIFVAVYTWSRLRNRR